MDRWDVDVFLETTSGGQAYIVQCFRVAKQALRPAWTDPAVRTLIFHDGSLGDVLLSLPCIMALGKPPAALDAVCRGDVGRLLRASGVVHGAFSSDSSAFSSWYAGRQDNACREMLARYGRVFVFTLREGSDLVQNIRRMVPDTRVIITVPSAGDRTHVAEFRLLQLPVALRNDGPVRLSVPPDLRRQAGEVLERAGLDGQGRLIVLHPGSGGKHKCWPLERYFALAEQLAEASGAFILFLSGTVEALPVRERIEGFVQARTCMAHVADADLTVVAGLLARGGLFVGNDSGISHLAAAIGAPVIALFGPTDPALWAPQGPNVQVIAATTLNAISVADVLEAAAECGARIVSA
jgi:heptosyltransferase III